MATPWPFLGRLGAIALAAAAAAPAAAQPRAHGTDRLMVRLADWADAGPAQPMGADRARGLSIAARSRLEPYRRMSGGAHVVRLTHDLPVAEVEAMATRLMNDPAVVHAEPDRRKFPLRVAADQLYAHQWNLLEPAGGINAPAATDRSGSRAPYASLGANVALAAPGGSLAANATSGANGILSLFNAGRTTPAADAFAFAAGTSEAAAHVSGVVALMVSANPGLAAADVRRILQTTARAFPNATCSPALCGAGIVDAAAAVAAAAAPPAPAAPVQSDPAPTPVRMTTPAATPVTADSGGGCTIARNGAPEMALPLLALWAFAAILSRRRREPRTRRA